MLPKILVIVGIIFFVFLMIVIYSCFILSGRISEMERGKEYKENIKN